MNVSSGDMANRYAKRDLLSEFCGHYCVPMRFHGGSGPSWTVLSAWVCFGFSHVCEKDIWVYFCVTRYHLHMWSL